MSSTNSSDSNGSSNVKEEELEEVTFLYEIEEDEVVYGSKKKSKKKDEDDIIEDLKPRSRKKPNEGGTIMRPLRAAIYQLEKKREKKEALYMYDEEDVVSDTIYEKVDSKEGSVYAKGKIRNKETTISETEKEEHVGRYSDMEVDYTFDEKPYHEVYLEEIVTEGRPTTEGKKKETTSEDDEEDAEIEDIIFDD